MWLLTSEGSIINTNNLIGMEISNLPPEKLNDTERYDYFLYAMDILGNYYVVHRGTREECKDALGLFYSITITHEEEDLQKLMNMWFELPSTPREKDFLSGLELE